MSGKSNLVAAIDVGTTKIVTLAGRLNDNGKLDILAMRREESRGVKRGVVFNIEETVTAILKTVNEVERLTGEKLSDVFVGIAGQHIRSIKNRGYIHRESSETEITKEDIRHLIDEMYKLPVDTGEEILHVLPESYIVDHEPGIVKPVGMIGRRLEGNFNIVIGQISAARNIEKCINRAHLNMKALFLEPLASAAAVLTEDEKEAGVAMLDIGGGTSDLAIYYDGIIRHTAVIPLGGNIITHDIKEGCAILQKHAEELKIRFGSAMGEMARDDRWVTIPGISGRDPKEISLYNLAMIIQSRMKEILDSVMFEIDSSNYHEKLSAGIVITGGGAMLRNLPQLVKFQTGYDVRLAYPSEYLSTESSKDVNHPAYSTAIGLLLLGIEWIKEHPEMMTKQTAQPVQKKTEVEEQEEPVAVEAEANESEDEVKKEKKKKKNPNGFFTNLKEQFLDIFDESNDAKL